LLVSKKGMSALQIDRETQFCWRLTRERFEEWGGREHNYRT
jgi:hypothetical protein